MSSRSALLAASHIVVGFFLFALFAVEPQSPAALYIVFLLSYFQSSIVCGWSRDPNYRRKRWVRTLDCISVIVYLFLEVGVFVGLLVDPTRTLLTVALFWYILTRYIAAAIVMLVFVLAHCFLWCNGMREQRLGATIATIKNYTATLVYDTLPFRGIDTCAICIQDFQQSDLICMLACRHYFHHQCIVQWLQQNKTCPYCRRAIDEDVPMAHAV